MELVLILIILGRLALALENVYKAKWSKGLRMNLFFLRKEATMGERVHLQEELFNENHIFMPYIELKYVIKNNGNDYESRREIFSLISMQRVKRTLDFPCKKRGVYDINQVYVISKGLFLRKMYDFHGVSKSRLIVYPKLVDVSQIQPMAMALGGEVKNRQRLMENPFFFCGVKEYQGTESISRVNWNATAQTGKLMTNTYEDTRRLEVQMILLLPDAFTEGASELAEESISLAASMYLKFMGDEIPVNMISNGTDAITGFPVSLCGRTDASYEKIALETFARINGNKLDETQGMEGELASTIVMISQIESAGRSMAQQALAYGQRGISVLWIVVAKRSESAEEAYERLELKYTKRSFVQMMPWWVSNN